MPQPAPASRRPTRIRVACAGWSIGAAHRGLFGAGGSMLERYATRFDAVEINSSFYRPHRRETYERWAASVPMHFRFSAKLPRSITHEQRLRGTGPMLDRFLTEVGGLGKRLGCLLVQLPPGLAFDARTAATFFAMLRRRWDGGVACEPRHASWFSPHAEALLQRHRVSRAAADPARVPAAAIVGGAPDLCYWRWHGAPRIYFSDYGEEALRALAGVVLSGTPARSQAWVVFDNTAHGHATANAARFRDLVTAAGARG